MTERTEAMISHWWWRPGWHVGRSFYTWHVTFDDNSAMARLASRYRLTLEQFPGLDVLRIGQLHLTIQGITDEVSDDDLSTIVAATEVELRAGAKRSVEAGPAHVDSETVQVALLPVLAVAEVRAALRRGIASAWGSDGVPESEEEFRPHVTLAYSNAENDRVGIARAVEQVDAAAERFRIDAVSLIRLNRDFGRYEWLKL